MVRQADPGIGDERAPIGSLGWAQRVRLHSQRLVTQALRYPGEVREYVDLIVKHRAWTLLNKGDGSTFTSWEEFCETPQPYGWGVPWAQLEGVINTALAKSSPGENVEKIVALGTVAPAKERAKGDNGQFQAAKPKGQNVPAESAAEKEAKRLRAINRAPEPIRDAYRADLIGKGLAAKLGAVDFDTDPERASVRAELVASVAALIAEKTPESKAERRSLRKAVDAEVKAAFASPTPDPVPSILRQLARLDAAQLARVVDEAQRLLAKGDHAP